MKKFREGWEKFLNLLYPEFKCFICGREAYDLDRHLCEKCKSELPVITGNVCEMCGEPLPEGNRFCEECQRTTHFFDGARAPLAYNDVTHGLVRGLKYHNHKYVAKLLGKEMARMYEEWKIVADIIVPVPLHYKREIERGYNQSMVLAEALSENIGVPVEDDLVTRVLETPTQTKLSKAQRAQNLKGAFDLNPNIDINGRTILIVDDVFTTGATVDAIAKRLKRRKPKAVYVLTATKRLYFSAKKLSASKNEPKHE